MAQSKKILLIISIALLNGCYADVFSDEYQKAHSTTHKPPKQIECYGEPLVLCNADCVSQCIMINKWPMLVKSNLNCNPHCLYE